MRHGQVTGNEARRPSPGALAAAALLVAVAYYLGADVGFLLRLPPATPSVVWPPNAILTVALLLTPTRRWWMCLLAAFPAHLLAELRAGWPLVLVLGLFVTNCAEALIAAASVRALSDAPTRFDTLRRVTVFVMGAGVLAPFASSFLDAGVVTAALGEPYWLVFRTRFFSNVLTELTLVPAAVNVITSMRSWLRGSSLRRILEAAFLVLALLAVGVTYVAAREDLSVLSVRPTPVALFLPFAFWAAVRFGPAGTSVSLFISVLIVIWAETHGRGTLATLPRAESVIALQLTLSVAAIPLLCLAGVIAERRRAQALLAERLEFEELLSRLSGAFVQLASDRMGEAFDTWLGRLGQFLALDRIMLGRLSEDGQLLSVAHSWAAPGVPAPPRVSASQDAATVEQLLSGQPVTIAGPDVTTGSPGDGMRSSLALPLASGSRVFGALVLETVFAERTWPPEQVGRLRLVAEVFANALARKESEDAVRNSEVMKSAILASLNSSVGVLDRGGYIVAVNEAWAAFPPHRVSSAPEELALGANYFEVCRRAARSGELHARQALAGIQAVLDGSCVVFDLEYSCRPSTGERWYAMSVVPLHRPEGGAVVSHTDVTEQKRAELEAQRSRQELAHVARVSTIGELTASLAHELNQPLAGILTNARAAQRLLELKPLDLDELRAILADIAEDDKRAADVINRLRGLLRNSESVRGELDLNVLVRDVSRLLTSDLIIKNVAMRLDLDEQPVVVHADRVQLEQVILNLMLNAMDAVAEGGGDTRNVVVRTRNCPEGAELAVADTGSGLRGGTEDLVFEPFYSTKPAGMGMGLAIARSLIEAHRGQIWAENALPRGAIFHVRLPVAARGA